jgi:fumarate reductase flavoprotein subunit
VRRAIGRLEELDAELDRTGVDGTHRDYNMSWHDWLNLKSLIAVSRVIAMASLARENSRGAHFREDFPEAGDLATSSYTVARQRGDRIEIGHEPVRFTRVKPGESLLREAVEMQAAR